VDRGLIADPALKAVAARLEAGQRLGWEEGMALMTSRDLLGLGALAHAARLALHGRRAFYVVNRHVNYSNVCVNRCAFCAFWREEGAADAYTLSPQEAAELAAAQPELPLSELHVVGSCHPELGLDYYLELLEALRQARPQATLKAFTPVEIDHMARREGMTAREILARLKQAGLAAMPGGGAEVFSPRVRARLCPRKISGQRWLEICGHAHRLGIPTNATMLYGHIETPRERVEHLLMLREQQDATGGFNAFIPLAFHPLNTALSQAAPTGGLDDLRLIAASRLLLDNFPHIKAYWVMLGEKLAGVALNFGADDLDGTIVEENITHAAGASTARGLSEARLRQLITAAGFTPVRRDAFYHSLEDDRP
jgi:aminodeoxyfutalosine synthase